eukprot:5188647-Pyramimonas_sp.AAC.3
MCRFLVARKVGGLLWLSPQCSSFVWISRSVTKRFPDNRLGSPHCPPAIEATDVIGVRRITILGRLHGEDDPGADMARQFRGPHGETFEVVHDIGQVSRAEAVDIEDRSAAGKSLHHHAWQDFWEENAHEGQREIHEGVRGCGGASPLRLAWPDADPLRAEAEGGQGERRFCFRGLAIMQRRGVNPGLDGFVR